MGKRAFLWRWASLITFLCAAAPWLVAFSCDPGDDTGPPPSECSADVSGTEARSVEVIDAQVSEPGTPLRSGDTISRVLGFQGSDMVTSIIRFDALADPDVEGSERCMRVTYSGATMDFERDLTFERRGDQWVIARSIFDPIESGGTFSQTVTVQDATIIGTSTLSLVVP